MSIFKILKGSSSRVDTTTTPYHEGYAYFTPDDGGFYIDAAVDGVNKRIRINPKDKVIDLTLNSSSWVNSDQTLSVTGLTQDAGGMIALSGSATEEQYNAAASANLYIKSQSSGSITISARGLVPSVNIPIVIVLFN